MNLKEEAIKRLKFLIELNAELPADEQIDASSYAAVHDFLLGWDEYNYGGEYREHIRDVTNAIIEEAM